jgi:hypothetical protein
MRASAASTRLVPLFFMYPSSPLPLCAAGAPAGQLLPTAPETTHPAPLHRPPLLVHPRPPNPRLSCTLPRRWVAKYSYQPAVAKLARPLVAATIEVYDLAQRELLPTPAKSHYTFNLRDVSKASGRSTHVALGAQAVFVAPCIVPCFRSRRPAKQENKKT